MTLYERYHDSSVKEYNNDMNGHSTFYSETTSKWLYTLEIVCHI